MVGLDVGSIVSCGLWVVMTAYVTVVDLACDVTWEGCDVGSIVGIDEG